MSLFTANHSQLQLNDIAKFVVDYNEEILILQFGDFGAFNSTLHQILIAKIESLVGKYLYPRGEFTTYSNMIASGKRIVAFYDAAEAVANNPHFWIDAQLHDDWANVDNYPAMLPVEVHSVEVLVHQQPVPNLDCNTYRLNREILRGFTNYNGC